MSNVADIATVLTTFVSLVFLWVLGFWCYVDFEVEWFRQKMFKLRDQMFDYVVAERISFTHPSYITLRHAMNGFIRFGERIGLVSTLILWRSRVIRTSPNAVTRFEDSMAQLPPAQRDRFRQFERDMHLIVTQHMILSSVLVILVFPLAVLIAVHRVGQGAIARASGVIKRLRLFDYLDEAAIRSDPA